MKKYLFYISQNYSLSILRPIQKLLRERGDEVCWFIEGNAVNPNYLTEAERRLHTVGQVISYNADAVLAPANKIPTFIPGLKVAIFHGFDAGKLDSKGLNDHFKIRGCFDLFCTQGPNTTQPFKKMQKHFGYFNVIETGWSALDVLFTHPVPKAITRKPVVLLCSTFSKKLSCAPQLFETAEKISRSGKSDWLVQFHPKMDKEIVKKYKSIEHEHLTYIETDDVIPLLQKADIMVCDTSSVISMFVVQNKPVVTFRNINPDTYMLNIEDSSKLEETIEYALSRPDSLMQHIAAYVEQLHPYQDGKSSQRVVKAIDDVLDRKFPVPKRKPFNFLTNLKFRARLNYWSW